MYLRKGINKAGKDSSFGAIFELLLKDESFTFSMKLMAVCIIGAVKTLFDAIPTTIVPVDRITLSNENNCIIENLISNLSRKRKDIRLSLRHAERF